MRERLAQLKKLTTEALILNCKKMRDNERKSEVALIAFLSELRSRCGFLDYGYNSIFTFCQQELGRDIEIFDKISKLSRGLMFVMTFMLALHLLEPSERSVTDFVMKRAEESRTPF
ncbi:MAG: hypothetical protein R3B45_12760 [Bdellovibrionota bacterium]